MPEAYSQHGWQAPHGVSTSQANITLLQLAEMLKAGGPPEGRVYPVVSSISSDPTCSFQVDVFASGPLMEGQLLAKATGAFDGVKELADLPTTAGKMLQLTRSTPGLLSTLVGHKAREHVEDNLHVGMGGEA